VFCTSISIPESIIAADSSKSITIRQHSYVDRTHSAISCPSFNEITGVPLASFHNIHSANLFEQRLTMHPKILLIEDKEYLRQSLLTMLMAEGYEVVGAEDGSIGVDLALTEAPDLVICDLKMPRLNGDQVLNILRHEPATQTLPFICISSDEWLLAPTSVRDLDSDSFLQKPFSRLDLLIAIEQQLSHKLAAAQNQN
jgi:CheY-like chemotaxis protein